MQHSAPIESLAPRPLASRIGAAVIIRLKRVFVLVAVIYATVFLLWLVLWLIGLDPTEACHPASRAGC